ANLPIDEDEKDDIERYLIATRSEILFSKGIIFVEGDAEEALIPSFAELLGYDLDGFGITVCNIGGVNFKPYVKLASSLGIPFTIITDWDPLDGTKQPLGKKRTVEIWDAAGEVNLSTFRLTQEQREWCDNASYDQFSAQWAKYGIFLNDQTFEVAIAQTPNLSEILLDILDEQGFGPQRTQRIKEWRGDHTKINNENLLSMIKD
ncbi:ATP-dependent endonuclease, partial [Acinetobacter baumannii]